MTLTGMDFQQQVVSYFKIDDFEHHLLYDRDDALGSIDQIHGITKRMRGIMGFDPDTDEPHQSLVAKTFLDRNVLSMGYTPSTASDNEGRDDLKVLKSVLMTQSSIQLEILCNHNLFISGCVVGGDYCRNGDIVTGEALIDAVALDEDTADLPRMVISEDIRYQIERLESTLYFISASSKIDWVIMKDENGEIFLNYLLAPAFFEEISLGAFDQNRVQESVIRHMMAIRHMMVRYRNDLRCDPILRRKLRWLIGYHNRVVSMTGYGQPIDVSGLY